VLWWRAIGQGVDGKISEILMDYRVLSDQEATVGERPFLSSLIKKTSASGDLSGALFAVH
jgi:hypothetical protein